MKNILILPNKNAIDIVQELPNGVMSFTQYINENSQLSKPMELNGIYKKLFINFNKYEMVLNDKNTLIFDTGEQQIRIPFKKPKQKYNLSLLDNIKIDRDIIINNNNVLHNGDYSHILVTCDNNVLILAYIQLNFVYFYYTKIDYTGYSRFYLSYDNFKELTQKKDISFNVYQNEDGTQGLLIQKNKKVKLFSPSHLHRKVNKNNIEYINEMYCTLYITRNDIQSIVKDYDGYVKPYLQLIKKDNNIIMVLFTHYQSISYNVYNIHCDGYIHDVEMYLPLDILKTILKYDNENIIKISIDIQRKYLIYESTHFRLQFNICYK